MASSRMGKKASVAGPQCVRGREVGSEGSLCSGLVSHRKNFRFFFLRGHWRIKRRGRHGLTNVLKGSLLE